MSIVRRGLFSHTLFVNQIFLISLGNVHIAHIFLGDRIVSYRHAWLGNLILLISLQSRSVAAAHEVAVGRTQREVEPRGVVSCRSRTARYACLCGRVSRTLGRYQQQSIVLLYKTQYRQVCLLGLFRSHILAYRQISAVQLLRIIRSAGSSVIEVDDSAGAVGSYYVALLVQSARSQILEQTYVYDGARTIHDLVGFVYLHLVDLVRDNGYLKIVILQSYRVGNLYTLAAEINRCLKAVLIACVHCRCAVGSRAQQSVCRVGIGNHYGVNYDRGFQLVLFGIIGSYHGVVFGIIGIAPPVVAVRQILDSENARFLIYIKSKAACSRALFHCRKSFLLGYIRRRRLLFGGFFLSGVLRCGVRLGGVHRFGAFSGF